MAWLTGPHRPALTIHNRIDECCDGDVEEYQYTYGGTPGRTGAEVLAAAGKAVA